MVNQAERVRVADMTIIWNRAAGYAESNLQYWNTAALRHMPVYKIIKLTGGWRLSRMGEQVCGMFSMAMLARKYAQRMEDNGPLYQTEEELGLGMSDGYAGAVCITSDGRGVAWGVYAGKSAAEREA